VINTEKAEPHNKAKRKMKRYNAAASAQTVQRCSDFLRTRQDSGTDDSRAQVPGTIALRVQERVEAKTSWHIEIKIS
jgi:hypothetical protein